MIRQNGPALSATNLSKTYWFYEKEAGLTGSLKALFRGKKVYVHAVRNIDLNLQLGEIVGFVGPNGAGKTTTLKMLSGILHPTAGHIDVMGFVPSRREKAFLSKITFVTGQRNRLFWDLPALEYFTFCKTVYEIPDDVYRKNLRLLVDQADIGDILNVPQRKLSAGQRKRCELVAALLHDPQIIFLDEPTNALDLVNARKMREFVKDKGTEGKHTIILTSHNMADIEQVCERLVIINRGALVYDGSISNLYTEGNYKKQVRVVFSGPWSETQLTTLGTIVCVNGHEVYLEVEPREAAKVASKLFAHFPVQDLGITDLPLEKIIETMYGR